jgi:hypothetical protein
VPHVTSKLLSMLNNDACYFEHNREPRAYCSVYCWKFLKSRYQTEEELGFGEPVWLGVPVGLGGPVGLGMPVGLGGRVEFGVPVGLGGLVGLGVPVGLGGGYRLVRGSRTKYEESQQKMGRAALINRGANSWRASEIYPLRSERFFHLDTQTTAGSIILQLDRPISGIKTSPVS